MIHRVVLDTNTRISGLIFGGKPREVVLLTRPPAFLPLVSEPLIAELGEILERKFQWPRHAIEAEITNILSISLQVTPTQTIQVCRDPDDNRILECAIAGKADFIVTGDKDLLTLHPFKGIPIFTVRQFLEQVTAR